MSSADSTLRVANDSGFPLQIAVERKVNETSGTHGWTVRYVEHSWSNSPEGQAGFIDLVLQDKHKRTLAVVECKRVRDAEWIFLHSAGRAPVERNAKGWVSHYANGSMAHFGWHELSPYPACVEAEYCAIRGQSSNDRTTLLERVGSDLLTATEALAAEERDFRPDTNESIKLYFSLVVTTADLKVGAFDPSKVSLKDGTLPDAEFESVPYLRFRKQLSTRQMRFSPSDYNNSTNIAYVKQHTVFVVRADALPHFLNDLCVPDSSLHHLPAA
jgi:hypothetical protein